MHKKFVPYFVDPATKEPLALEVMSSSGDIIESGSFRSPQNIYPIIEGVPRFAGRHQTHYSGSFGYEWRRWPRIQFDSENLGKPMEGYTQTMWERITGHTGDLAGQVVLDMGCGAGRFIEVARHKRAQVIGLDFSAADVAASNFKNDPDVCICQADVLNLPIKESTLDGAFTIGVLHHTPSPKQGIQQAIQAIKLGGWFAVCVYGKNTYYDFPTVQAWRKLFTLLEPHFRYYPPLLYSYLTAYGFYPLHTIPLLTKALRLFFPYVSLPDVRWSLLDTFDSITPAYQSTHTSYEVFSWMKEAGFVKIEPHDWSFTSYHGIKGLASNSC